MRVVTGSTGAMLSKSHETNSTATSFTAPAATTTKPSGPGVVDFSNAPPSWLKVVVFGAGSDDNTLDVRLIGWRLIGSLWIPMILVQFGATLSTSVGVSGADVTDTDRFADTLADPTSPFGEKGVTCQPFSPANNSPGFYLVDACGCPLFRVDVDVGTATSGNALIGPA